MFEIQKLLYTHLTKYPGMELEDCIKLVYQSAMGPGHLEQDEAAFAEHLKEELATPGLITAQPYQPEDIGPAYSRVYLSGFDQGPTVETFTRLCVRSAAEHPGDTEALQAGLAALRHLAAEGLLPYTPQEAERVINQYILDGCPQPRHSGRYQALFNPHYRVLARDMAFYLPVFAAVDAALARKPHVLVGIDGMSGAGKSGLARMLQSVYGCGVVHTDDFFLQPWQRTADRLASPGGNIDYERLAPVAAQAADDRAFSYRRYDCAAGQLAEACQIPEGCLTVLEGVYALHPKVDAACDVRIFLRVDAAEQARRILARNGQALAARFEAEWIPMENRYFVEFQIRDGCDVQLDTSAL